MKRAHEGASQNPLFTKWLEEMKEEAAADNSPFQFTIGRALNSLKRCPYTLESGKDCLILQSCGPKICEMLDEKLDEYKKTHSLPAANDVNDDKDIGGKRTKKNVSADKLPDQLDLLETKPRKLEVSPEAYIILTVMNNMQEESDYQGYVTKEDIVSEAQRYFDYLMKDNTSDNDSVWSAMPTLIEKHYVVEESPEEYSLTDSGAKFIALSLTENSANPLFEKWLTEMIEQAAENKDNIHKYGYKRSLASLKKCPVTLKSPEDCLMLRYFGRYTCDVLNKKFELYKKFNNLSKPSSALVKDEAIDVKKEAVDVKEEQLESALEISEEASRKPKTRGGKK